MRKAKTIETESPMQKEYDFSKGVRGKFAKRFQEGTNIIVLDPDLADLFPDSKSVNEALRFIARIVKKKVKKAS